MAKKATDSDKKVTRISASDSRSPKKETKATAAVKKVEAKKTKKATQPKSKKESRGPIGYFKGAWYELKQVRWPTRSATWSLTVAVLAFSAFFILFIFALDSLFKYLFELILK